ncbi:phosphohistidine phosphatase [Dyadobacter jejuensis]|uniref:Phosphohistidine phosphatase n=1 Tax=Dyadobacter jejuensis TaxID=1082580 RepID=A0A316APA7_9BACT|nr:histidine phosphatase family protein [Dyadobacter jejuensis]PWJ59331.1 phosphohistidine phosphatase [Dyadobacter jejuensis]
MTKTLILVRHATAEDASLTRSDFDRRLVEKGKEESQTMAHWLMDLGYRPEVYMSSSAARALQTAELIAQVIGADSRAIIQDRDIYDAGSRGYLHALNETPEPATSLLLVGHNPDISFFADYLSPGHIGSMKKAGIVILEFEVATWAEISYSSGNFKIYMTPKQLREGL